MVQVGAVVLPLLSVVTMVCRPVNFQVWCIVYWRLQYDAVCVRSRTIEDHPTMAMHNTIYYNQQQKQQQYKDVWSSRDRIEKMFDYTATLTLCVFHNNRFSPEQLVVLNPLNPPIQYTEPYTLLVVPVDCKPSMLSLFLLESGWMPY